ncbi:DUF4831 family protein [Bacteroides sp. 519]|uniref:DUF4831 family protein n=1 Tax=Bacteroides sp. 519 TaxID=2302937 RepID=UPI0013D2D98A|nr:DUF4831 family protein [Bacteroides sp. 519]NDV59163.1 DUF4831 family protein [Bacteroides sp. 519]
MRKALFIFGLFIATIATAQTQVTPGVTMGKDYGVLYTLPKTEINIEVTATQVVYTPGQFSRYADRYLRLTNVSANPEEYWELNEVKAVSVGVPDNKESYFIKLKDKTVAPLVELTEDGLIKSINVPYVSQKPVMPENRPSVAPKKVNPKDFLTEEILMANSTAKMAELVAKEIYSIRESRNALLRGQADNTPKDGEQLRLMLESLDQQENAMVEMFSGVRTKEKKTFNIRFTPTHELQNEIVFRFSKKLGILNKENLAGSPIYISLSDLKTVGLPQQQTEDPKKKDIKGVAYNVPGKGLVTITLDREKLFEGDLPVTQFGIVEYLAPTLFDKNSTVQVIFNTNTGGIIKVERQ